MITFQYKALDKSGRQTKGIVQAMDEFEAVRRIRENCPVITEIKEVKDKSGSIFTRDLGSGKIREKELAVMCSQFSIMLKSGIPISRAVHMIARQTEDKQLKKALSSAGEDVEQGSMLATALERNCKGFPVTFLETLRAGEQSGTIEQSFERLHLYYEKSYKNNEKIKSALGYPIFVVIVAIVVLIIVMVKVIPALAGAFTDLGGNLPLLTQLLIGISNFFQKAWPFMAIIAVVIILAIQLYKRTDKGALALARLSLKLPVIGKINVLNGAAQFADTMSAMIASGLPVNKAIEVTANVFSNIAMAEDVRSMVPKIEAGRTLGASMRETTSFPDNLKEMCAIGEESGALDETLDTVGEYYHNEADNAMKKVISKLEPTLLICLALFAGFIVIAIYLPMFTMYDLM
ncbi:MAG: type II secretion system F family protein [Eubacterium sp.]|nr:type II secretion system F family protein [Eubacterium sp.]